MQDFFWFYMGIGVRTYIYGRIVTLGLITELVDLQQTGPGILMFALLVVIKH